MASVPRGTGKQPEPLGREVDRRGRAAGAAAAVVIHWPGRPIRPVIPCGGGVGGDEGGGLRGLAGAEGDRHAHCLVAG